MTLSPSRRGRALRGGPAAAALAALLIGCLEYSPHAVPDEAKHRDVHRHSLERLLAQPPPEILRFAVVGDTQRGFDQTRDAIESLNRRDDIAFVVQVGDFTHFGLADEYELTNEMFARLRVPYFVAIGNHDFLSNGRRIFESVFGPWNFAFTWAATRFVFIDTNSQEAGFDGAVPDLAWLAEQLAPAPDHVGALVFAHVDPESTDFDGRLQSGWYAILRGGRVAASFHGHAHHHRTYEREGVLHVIADDVRERVYYVVTERPGGFDVEEVPF